MTRLRSTLFTIAIAAIALVINPERAHAQANFAETVTFGDSLTHNDLLWLVSGTPREVYGDDPFQALFDRGRSSGDDLTSYAVAGSESDDLLTQIEVYDFARLIRAQDRATLLGIEIGGNDILNNLDALASAAPGENPVADAVIDNLIANLREAVTSLSATHPNGQLVIWTVPDVTITAELVGGLTANEIDNIQAHTEVVNRRIRSLDRYRNVVVLDLFALRDLALDPPVLRGQQLDPPPDYGDFDDIFADEIHPTAVTNALIANGMILGINRKWRDDIPPYTEDELADLARIP
ncbi:MAG: GDSL-type esterase/lipase family protein [Phycisphaerales bacterium]